MKEVEVDKKNQTLFSVYLPVLQKSNKCAKLAF